MFVIGLCMAFYWFALIRNFSPKMELITKCVPGWGFCSQKFNIEIFNNSMYTVGKKRQAARETDLVQTFFHTLL